MKKMGNLKKLMRCFQTPKLLDCFKQRNASSKNSKNAQTDQKSCKSERKRSRMNKSHFLATQRGNTCIAIWDHVTCEQDELQFRCGDVIEILDQSNRNWWLGKMFTRDDLGDQTRNETKNAGQSEHGWFPSIFVQVSPIIILSCHC